MNTRTPGEPACAPLAPARALQVLAWREPVEVLAALAQAPWSVGLLSDGATAVGRWSYVAAEPHARLVMEPGCADDPFQVAARLLGPMGQVEEGPPFQGGLVGLAAYELGDRVEPLDLKREPGWPDLVAGLYLAVLAFDHHTRRVFAIGRGKDPVQAEENLARAKAWLARPVRGEHVVATRLHPDPPAAYEAAVAQVVERIHAGELFQTNIARAWRGRLDAGDPIDVLARLYAQSPAPFAGYLRLPDRAVISNSPERFVTVRREGQDLVAESRPIKGTRPRSPDPVVDQALAQALLASQKDRAENLMIVDLMRNDLARVCAPGTVKAPELFILERYANVHHLVSSVQGRLRHAAAALDLFRAAYPPGSITGAPKVQAMTLIRDLEAPRGPYCGSLFWAGLDGAFDSSVLIRTAACVLDGEGWTIRISAGAGIVADSDPVDERIETETKASALLRALGADGAASA